MNLTKIKEFYLQQKKKTQFINDDQMKLEKESNGRIVIMIYVKRVEYLDIDSNL